MATMLRDLYTDELLETGPTAPFDPNPHGGYRGIEPPDEAEQAKFSEAPAESEASPSRWAR